MRAQSTEHRAQSTEHRAQSTEHRAQYFSKTVLSNKFYFSLELLKPLLCNNKGLSLISVMISSVIAGILITGINTFLSNSFKAQKLIEKRGLRKDIVDHYVFKLNDSKIKDFTKTHSANATLKAHVEGSVPQPLTTMPSSLGDVPSPLYPSGSNGIAIYETASKVLIPKTGLFLNTEGAPCLSPSCTDSQKKWKILVQWAALDNRGYDFFLSISDHSSGLQFKTYSRLMGQLLPSSIGSIQCVTEASRPVRFTLYANHSSVSKVYKAVASTTCPANFTIVSCGADRISPISFQTSSSAIQGTSITLPPDAYIDSNRCITTSTVVIHATTASRINQMASAIMGIPGTSLVAIANCCKMKSH